MVLIKANNCCYRNICNMSLISFSLAVIFIIRLFSTSAFQLFFGRDGFWLAFFGGKVVGALGAYSTVIYFELQYRYQMHALKVKILRLVSIPKVIQKFNKLCKCKAHTKFQSSEHFWQLLFG